jgi:general secretion pathway protein K
MRKPFFPAQARRGAALLAALVTVTMVATLASAGLWQQWRAIEVEAAERERSQAAWILTGAMDWSRLILREDAAAGGPDHLAEPWAIGLREARLSTFLSADRDAAAAGSLVEEAFLSGDIVDLQARLNLANLGTGPQPSETGLRSFRRLFVQLGLPVAHLDGLAGQWIRAQASGDASAGATPEGAPVPLRPWRVSQLGWLGVPPATVAALAPHVVILPEPTPVNLNTASVTVIAAAVDGASLADAQRLAQRRAGSPLRSLQEAAATLGHSPESAAASVSSRFFEIRGRLRMNAHVVEEHLRVQRDQGQVRILDRERPEPVPR